MNTLEKFAAVEKLAKGVADNLFRNLLITGDAGLGKTYGVLKAFKQNKNVKYINGSISPVGLFCALYKHRKSNQILVLDDADDILFKHDAVNVLKCAIDTTEGREVTWEKFSNTLIIEGVPKQFVYEGKIVIISNLDLGVVHKKKTKVNLHLRALADRCHHLDISNLSTEEKINRIRHLVFEHNMFKTYQVDYARKKLMDWIELKQNNLKTVNLRTALKVAEIYKHNKTEWQQLAEETLC